MSTATCLHSAPTGEAAVLVQAGAPRTLRAVTARTRACVGAQGCVIDLHHGRVTSRSVTSALLHSSLLASARRLGGGDGCLSHSHRTSIHLSRNHSEINRTRFVAIISARDRTLIRVTHTAWLSPMMISFSDQPATKKKPPLGQGAANLQCTSENTTLQSTARSQWD
jgi:hypothetical protein